MRRHSG